MTPFRPARGASIVAGGVDFAVDAPDADAVTLCLFDAEDRETGRAPMRRDAGGVYVAHLPGAGAGLRYGLRAEGPFRPEDGLRFDAAKLLVDPYALAIDRPFAFNEDLRRRGAETAHLAPKAVVTDLPLVAPLPPGRPMRVIYEVSVRAFSMRHPRIDPALRGTLAALASPPAIEHLLRLGVDAVELMPLAAAIDERHLVRLGLRNAWGYNPVATIAPDPRLVPGGWPEVAATVAALHAVGIAVLLDVVFNHTGESDADGPTLSMRGLANRDWYRLAEGRPGEYVNDAGTGNILDADQPMVRDLVVAALSMWAEAGGVDGFRFDLAPVLGRSRDGFRPDHPLLAAIASAPALSGRALIAEPWDIGPGGYRLGGFPPPWREWNDRYRDDVRRFWRGDPGALGAFATRLCGSADVFAASGRPPSASVNFVAAHDGMTLADLVSHARKHNEANGEDNRDGTNADFSWNNGIEGASADPAVLAARDRDVRALLATLFVSRGALMLTAGDEFGRSQGGNNNAYAQDDATTWLDWEAAQEDRIGFVATLSRLSRRAAFAADAYLTGQGAPPDVAWLRPDGARMTVADWERPDARAFLMLLGGAAGEGSTLVAVNGGAPLSCRLPPPGPAHSWRLAIASAEAVIGPGETLAIGARSVAVLVADPP
jgi:glycogen operon protein